MLNFAMTTRQTPNRKKGARKDEGSNFFIAYAQQQRQQLQQRQQQQGQTVRPLNRGYVEWKKKLNNGIFLPRTNDNAEDHRQHITFLGKAGGASFEGGGGGGGLCVSST